MAARLRETPLYEDSKIALQAPPVDPRAEPFEVVDPHFRAPDIEQDFLQRSGGYPGPAPSVRRDFQPAFRFTQASELCRTPPRHYLVYQRVTGVCQEPCDYLRRNGLLTRADGGLRLAENAMVALALLVAESAPSQKELMVRLILCLLEENVG